MTGPAPRRGYDLPPPFDNYLDWATRFMPLDPQHQQDEEKIARAREELAHLRKIQDLSQKYVASINAMLDPDASLAILVRLRSALMERLS